MALVALGLMAACAISVVDDFVEERRYPTSDQWIVLFIAVFLLLTELAQKAGVE